MDQYAVFGNPINHSKSSWIHRAFAAATNQTLAYETQLVELNAFAVAAKHFFDEGGKGLNITVPFKQDAYQFANLLSSRARRAGAVNTLALQPDGSILGDNTDGLGLVRDITDNQGWQINGKNLLLLGAGGAVRGVLAPLLEQQPASVTIANRTASKAIALAKAFSGLGEIRAIGMDALETSPPAFDLVINGTSASLLGGSLSLHDDILAESSCAYDMVYAAKPSDFLLWAGTRGARTADGLGMLVCQAAESFRIWRGIMPQTAAVISELRASL